METIVNAEELIANTSAVPLKLGQVTATNAVVEAFTRNDQSVGFFLGAHAAGFWGDLDDAAWKANDAAFMDGALILSSYMLRDGTRFWIVTHANRKSTRVVLPGEY